MLYWPCTNIPACRQSLDCLSQASGLPESEARPIRITVGKASSADAAHLTARSLLRHNARQSLCRGKHSDRTPEGADDPPKGPDVDQPAIRTCSFTGTNHSSPQATPHETSIMEAGDSCLRNTTCKRRSQLRFTCSLQFYTVESSRSYVLEKQARRGSSWKEYRLQ